MPEAWNHWNPASILAELFQLKHQIKMNGPDLFTKNARDKMMLAVVTVGAELLSALMGKDRNLCSEHA